MQEPEFSVRVSRVTDHLGKAYKKEQTMHTQILQTALDPSKPRDLRPQTPPGDSGPIPPYEAPGSHLSSTFFVVNWVVSDGVGFNPFGPFESRVVVDLGSCHRSPTCSGSAA